MSVLSMFPMYVYNHTHSSYYTTNLMYLCIQGNFRRSFEYIYFQYIRIHKQNNFALP
jgi:hypothetical protein